MAEEAVAEVGEDTLSRPAREVRLRSVGAEIDEAGGDERADDPAERRQVALRDAVVDRELRQVRGRERGERRDEEEAERERDAALVRLGEPRERSRRRRVRRQECPAAGAWPRSTVRWEPGCQTLMRWPPRRRLPAFSLGNPISHDPRAEPSEVNPPWLCRSGKPPVPSTLRPVQSPLTPSPPLSPRTPPRAARARTSRGRRGSRR